jgi:hypothetical protein
MLSSRCRVSAMQFLRQWPASSARGSLDIAGQTFSSGRRPTLNQVKLALVQLGAESLLMNFGWHLSPV